MENNLTEDLRQKHKKKRGFLHRFYSMGDPFKSPSKGLVITIVLVWFIGILLLVLAMTDLFRENFFNGKYLISYFLMIGATVTVTRMVIAYITNKQKK